MMLPPSFRRRRQCRRMMSSPYMTTTTTTSCVLTLAVWCCITTTRLLLLTSVTSATGGHNVDGILGEDDYVEHRFREQVARAMEHVNRILETHRQQPQLIGTASRSGDATAQHVYEDKYLVTEFATNLAVAAHWNVLDELFGGLTAQQKHLLVHTVNHRHRPVTLDFEMQQTCTFLKEEEIEVAVAGNLQQSQDAGNSDDGEEETTVEEITVAETGETSEPSTKKTTTTKTTTRKKTKKSPIVHKVKQHHWQVRVAWSLSLLAGGGGGNGGGGTDKNTTKNTQQQQQRVLVKREPVPLSMTLVTTTGTQDDAPVQNSTTAHDPIQLDLTWLLQNVGRRQAKKPVAANDDGGTGTEENEEVARETQHAETTVDSNDPDYTFGFQIDRSSATRCKTPRRNPDVDNAVSFVAKVHRWSELVLISIVDDVSWGIIENYKPQHPQQSQKLPHPPPPPPLTMASTKKYEKILNPVMPLMQNETHHLANTEISALIQGHVASIQSMLRLLDDAYPSIPVTTADDESDEVETAYSIISSQEARLVVLCQHLRSLASQYSDSVGYIEDLLKQQLVQAIGKDISVDDFHQFIRSHFRSRGGHGGGFFMEEYSPIPFSRAIRRPEHYPDGIVSIEENKCRSRHYQDVCNTMPSEPVYTMSRSINSAATTTTNGNDDAAQPLMIQIPINAATTVQVSGEQYLHGWLMHKFGVSEHTQANLKTAARQFSSFILVIGQMSGPDRFDPKHAIIVKDKDDVLIPLITKTLPSAKQFRDAISSLSPEQQAFAKAIRSMQLQSSVFAMSVIRIKPQLERLLNLPDGALTKEIQLTQDLMTLFIDYQIPSDLLSFDDVGYVAGDHNTPVGQVKEHVKAVLDVIDQTKLKQLEEEKRRAEMKKAEAESTRPSVTPSSGPSASPSSSTSGSQTVRLASFSGEKSASRSHGQHQQARNLRVQHSSVDSGESMNIEDEREAGSDDQGQTSRPYSARSQSSPMDFTMIPLLLDAQLEKYDRDGYLRSTTIEVGSSGWIRQRQENLLQKSKTAKLPQDAINGEKRKAYDLLDALSRSGSLPIASSETHVIIAMSHCFANSIIETIIKDNVNPIEKLEKSMVLLAATISGVPTSQLIGDSSTLQRLAEASPELFESDAGPAVAEAMTS